MLSPTRGWLMRALAATKTREQALEVVRPSDEFERSEQLEAAVRKAFQ